MVTITTAPPLGIFVDHGQNAVLAGYVEAGDRLVEQDESGLGSQSLGNPHPLLLPPAQTTEVAVLELGDLEVIGRFKHGRAVRGPEPAGEAALTVADPWLSPPRR